MTQSVPGPSGMYRSDTVSAALNYPLAVLALPPPVPLLCRSIARGAPTAPLPWPSTRAAADDME